MNITIDFHGAAGTVTGSCYRIRTSGGELLVDCGLFQGPKTLRALNYRKLPFDAGAIGAVLLTHAHIDHTGMFPKLALAGFRGRAWTTPATRDLLQWLLPDAGAIQEGDVDRLNRRNQRRGIGAVSPIYTAADADACLRQVSVKDYDSWFEPVAGIRCRFRNAGHILGSTFIEMEIQAEPRAVRMVFSGDLGPRERALEPPSAAPFQSDVALIESTYGNTIRPSVDEASRRRMLGRELTDGLAAGGNVIVPVFAVERTQEILRDIGLLKQAGQIAKTPVFLDSPLAGRTTEVFHRHRADLGLAGERDVFGSDAFHLTETVEQSKAISRIRGGAIILAGSGMCDGGRVKYHLKDNLWRPDSTILFVGYQVPGTLGSIILRGAPRVRIHGEEIAVKARIRRIEAYSGHADRDDLVEWARPMLGNLGTALLVHGEEDGLRGLAAALEAAGVAPARIRIPRLDQRFVLSWQDDRWVATPDLAFDSLQRLPPGIAGAHRDWHNDYAQALLDLQGVVRDARDDAARQRTLQRINAVLHEARGIPDRDLDPKQ